ncbi:MAG: EAL domain-containing protein [Gammaproteobacteria bacterium]|nr:EAL domain-containing protein [Gammaproteobacteria bacterium]
MKISIRKFFDACLEIGCSSEDSEALRLKKSSLVLVPLIIGTAAFLWGIIYIFLEQYLSASIPLSYSIISLFNLWHFQKTKNIMPLQKSQMILVLLLPFFLMWSLGGFARGSFVMIWAFFAPIAALTFERTTKALYWFYAFLALVIFSTMIDVYLQEKMINTMPQLGTELFFLLNISAGLSGIYLLIKHFIDEKEKNANERLQKEHEALLQSTQELKEANLKLEHLAAHDVLTRLPNRYHLHNCLSQMIACADRYQHTMALLFIDLDGFKKVNDNFGHAKGDEILQVVGKRLKSLLREEDTIARIGGDEFAIGIGRIVDTNYIDNLAQRLIDDINLEYPSISSYSSLIGASVGISFYPDDCEDVEDLICNADAAMYHAKQIGPNKFQFFNEDINQRNKNRHLLENSLRRAINDNEFEIHYQPQIDILTEQMIGAEALIRWNDPQRGLISPVEFIPIIEQNGMILEIGRWIFKETCRYLRQSLDAGKNTVPIAINLSAIQFRDQGLVAMIEGVLKEENLSSEWIELEITESAVMENADKAIIMLEKLSNIGIKISIDDFGTGYSSLAYLKKFPIDKLKIDREFISGLPDNKNDIVLTTAIINLSSSLGIYVLAEGAETKEQVDFLRDKGCQFVQGYYYSKPLPEDKFSEYLSSVVKVSSNH